MAAPWRGKMLRAIQGIELSVRLSRSALHTEPQLPPRSLYPPVVASLTAMSKASSRRRYEEERKLVHAAPVKEKIRLLTKLRRLKFMVYPQTFALNADRWYQDYTKTVVRQGLPPGLATEIPGVDLGELRSLVCDALLQETFYLKKRRSFLTGEQEHAANPFLTNLSTMLRAELARHNPLLASSHLDLNPNVNFYWMRGETVVPRGHRKGKVDPVRFQIDDTPLTQIRVHHQLNPFVPLDDLVPEDVPAITVQPDKLPLFKRQYENTIFIGCKLEDPCCYGHTQFHVVSGKMRRASFLKANANVADQIEVRLRAHAIASLFAWTGAQAMYQGFWSYSDVTRPFVSQCVILDEKYFSFFCYQLNTLALDVETDKNNPRKNICWGTQSIPLYESIEGNDVKGFNDEVLMLIVRLLLNRPL